MLEPATTAMAMLLRPLSNETLAWAEELLSPRALAADGLFDVAAVRGAWTEHLSGARNWDRRIWTLLMFQAWRAAQKEYQTAIAA